MALLDKVLIKKPKYSNFDLSRISQFTMMPGALYPALIEEILPGDKVKLRIDSKMMTYPLKAPLLSTFKLQADLFFVPTRLFVRKMRVNTPDFDPSSVGFPYFKMPVAPQGNPSDFLPLEGMGHVKKSSLLDFMGLPFGFANFVPSDEQIRFNAIPALGYYGICVNYYASSQYGEIPVINNYFPNDFNELNGLDSVSYDQYNGWIEQIEDSSSLSVDSVTYSPKVPFVEYSTTYNSGGLCLKAYQPDVNNRWLSKGVYDDMVTRASISTENGSVTINQIRYANKLVKYLERFLVSGGKYSDFVLSEYGVKTDRNLDIPEFLGSSSTEVFFTEVVSNSNTPSEETGLNGLGDLAGKGNARLNGQMHYFTASEHGYLFVMVSLTPRVTYFQGARPYLLKTNLQDVFAPALDNLGFQPVMESQLNVFGQLVAEDDSYVYSRSRGNYSNDAFNNALAYQPAWIEYMTASNEVHGELTDSLRYWTLSRSFTSPALVEDVGNYNIKPDYRPFVNPTLYNYAFENVDTFAENFIAQFAFDLFMKRCISKQIMPTL